MCVYAGMVALPPFLPAPGRGREDLSPVTRSRVVLQAALAEIERKGLDLD